jgi:hypothetical protein
MNACRKKIHKKNGPGPGVKRPEKSGQEAAAEA